MASKLAAARIAAWSGVRAVIAAARREHVVLDALRGESVGTTVAPRARTLASRKLWIAFARPATGRLVIDDGAVTALTRSGRSLLAAGVRAVEGVFDVDDAVEVVDLAGGVVAKGLVRWSAVELAELAVTTARNGRPGRPSEVIHRDDLVVLAEGSAPGVRA